MYTVKRYCVTRPAPRYLTCGECFARVSATLQVFTPEWFLMAPLVDWEVLERLMMFRVCSWSRSCCPDCSACSGVLVEGRMNEEEDVLVVNEAGERATKGETCADQMTDSFQAHKDVMQFLSQACAVRSALVNRLYCAVCAVFTGVLSTHTRRFSGILSRKPKSPPFLR